MASNPSNTPGTKAHFVAWLQQQNSPEADYALIRHFNAPLPNTGKKSNMSGHFHSGFDGIRAFFRANPVHQGTLLATSWTDDFWDIHPQLKQDFRQFVAANGGNFPGQRQGDWRKKLPVPLGGFPNKKAGGRGSGLVARLLILVDLYGNQHGY